ncbi:MAG: helix-turn-helix domain-containing protein [Oscillospiraceae bacterium]|nr:helix-turn-helix domain-containing protein [Oscillospiraceae bacterium]
MLKIDERIRALRKENDLTQEEAAKLCEISNMSYCRYERGEREPSASILWRMADLFGVSIDYLVGRTDER